MTPTEINKLADRWTDLSSRIDDVMERMNDHTSPRAQLVLEYLLIEIEQSTDKAEVWL